ncbi:unnamed protein product [Closterium sp. Naga37s-1]|nr:unnamed protein product [Closterium sp. Naga37s-1]
MPPRRSARGKGKEKLSDDEPMEDPPYVAWMKEQQKQGKPSPSIKRIAKAKRDSAGASTSSGPGHDDDETRADTDVSDDELEEIVSESDSDADSDNYKAGSDDEEEDSDGAEEGSGDDRSTRRSKKEKRPPATRNKRVWSDAELTSLAAARWNTKDDLKAMQGKQGSQYWKKLRAHMVERDATWARDEGQMSNAWKRLEKKYLKTKWSETQSGGKAIKKKPWWDYVYHLKKHSAKANAHALDGGGAANVDVPARIDETATMATAKLVSDAIHSSNAMALRQLQDSTRLLVSAMNMAAMQAGLRQQMASSPVPPAAPATTPPPAPPADASDANMAGSEDVAEQHEP